MSPVVVSVLCGLVTGVVVTAIVARWPRLDPMMPSIAPARVEGAVSDEPALKQAVEEHDPTTVTTALLGLSLAFISLMTVAFGALLWMVRGNFGLARFDRSAAVWGAHHASQLSTQWLRWISQLGGTQYGIALAVVVVVLELRRRSTYAVIAFLVLTIGGQNIIVNVSKVIIDRARPDIDRLTGFSGASFPSGHSAQAAAMFAAFALVLGRRRSRTVRAVLAGVASGIAVTVAATRVMLGVHWLTDVLAGLAIGWGWFAVTSISFGGRWLHFAAPAEQAKAAVDAPARE